MNYILFLFLSHDLAVGIIVLSNNPATPCVLSVRYNQKIVYNIVILGFVHIASQSQEYSQKPLQKRLLISLFFAAMFGEKMVHCWTYFFSVLEKHCLFNCCQTRLHCFYRIRKCLKKCNLYSTEYSQILYVTWNYIFFILYS